MIVTIYNFLLFFQSLCVLGNVYAAVKFYRLPYRMGRYVAFAFGSYAVAGLLQLVRFGFAPRPAQIVWWPIISAVLQLLITTAGVGLLTIFLFGWINGVGNYAKKDNDDRTLDNNS
jgi:VIT1/CCC1 family predicted Fe2+/Mn2+ transporter